MSEGLNVHITGELERYLYNQIGPNGLYENVEEYIRDLIRQDYKKQDASKQEQWQWLEKELADGFYTQESELKRVSAYDVIKRNM